MTTLPQGLVVEGMTDMNMRASRLRESLPRVSHGNIWLGKTAVGITVDEAKALKEIVRERRSSPWHGIGRG